MSSLDQRRGLDTRAGQIARAKSAVDARAAELIRSDLEIRNAESRVRALVNDPDLGLADQFELLPSEYPMTNSVPLNMVDSVATAMQNRPELQQAMKEIRGSAVRLGMARNELLPALDLVLESYVAGLRGDARYLESIGDQFSEGAPSYTAGLKFDLPWKNRAARSRELQRRIELRRMESQLEATLDTLRFEVEVAVREVEVTYREFVARSNSVSASCPRSGISSGALETAARGERNRRLPVG